MLIDLNIGVDGGGEPIPKLNAAPTSISMQSIPSSAMLLDLNIAADEGRDPIPDLNTVPADDQIHHILGDEAHHFYEDQASSLLKDEHVRRHVIDLNVAATEGQLQEPHQGNMSTKYIVTASKWCTLCETLLLDLNIAADGGGDPIPDLNAVRADDQIHHLLGDEAHHFYEAEAPSLLKDDHMQRHVIDLNVPGIEGQLEEYHQGNMSSNYIVTANKWCTLCEYKFDSK